MSNKTGHVVRCCTSLWTPYTVHRTFVKCCVPVNEHYVTASHQMRRIPVNGRHANNMRHGSRSCTRQRGAAFTFSHRDATRSRRFQCESARSDMPAARSMNIDNSCALFFSVFDRGAHAAVARSCRVALLWCCSAFQSAKLLYLRF